MGFPFAPGLFIGCARHDSPNAGVIIHAPTSDELVALLGDYRAAAACFRQRMTRRHGAEVCEKRVAGLGDVLSDGHTAYLVHTASKGVHMHSDKPASNKPLLTTPHKSAAEHVVEALVTVAEDFRRGGVLVLSDRSEKFLGDVQTSPFGRVLKKTFDGTVTEEGRFVHDLSYPRGASRNDATPLENHPPAKCPRHAHLLRNVIWKAHHAPGVPIIPQFVPM